MVDPFMFFHLPVPNICVAAADGLVHARDILVLAMGKFWQPKDLASVPRVSPWSRDGFLGLLRVVEHMLRRLMFIEAASMASGLPEPTIHPKRAHQPHEPKPLTELDPEHPETWRTTFRITPPQPRDAKPRERSPKCEEDNNTFLPSRPLALRLEGVIRAAVDPMPFILRLAARLRRASSTEAARSRFKSFRKPPRHKHGYARPTFRDLIETLEPLFANSS